MILGVSRRQQTVVTQGSEQEFDVDSDVELNVDEQCEQSSDEDGQVLEPWVDWIRRATPSRTTNPETEHTKPGCQST